MMWEIDVRGLVLEVVFRSTVQQPVRNVLMRIPVTCRMLSVKMIMINCDDDYDDDYEEYFTGLQAVELAVAAFMTK